MTEHEEFYHRLVLIEPSARKQWLVDHRTTSVSPARWWLSLIEAAVRDVRCEHRGRPPTGPRADLELAASLIDWALEDDFPIDAAVRNLVELATIAVAAGREADLRPATAGPDSIARRALERFGFSRPGAIARAAELRARPVSGDDLRQPGEGPERLRLLSRTDDYQDTTTGFSTSSGC